MAQLQRLRVQWGGSPVTGPGLSTFYATTAGSGYPAAVHAFFTAIRSAFPSGLTWTIPQDGDLIEDTTGGLAGSWSEGSGGGVVTGGGSANFANGVGMRVQWRTGGIFRGRRVRGSTFLCPMVSGVYLADGTIDDVTVAGMQTAATNLIAAVPNLSIFSRPAFGTPGTHSIVTSAIAVDRVSWLRSRRT